jgi:hypothetical protein
MLAQMQTGHLAVAVGHHPSRVYPHCQSLAIMAVDPSTCHCPIAHSLWG